MWREVVESRYLLNLSDIIEYEEESERLNRYNIEYKNYNLLTSLIEDNSTLENWIKKNLDTLTNFKNCSEIFQI